MESLEPLAAVLLVLALLGLALFFLKKRGVASFHSGTRRVEVMERVMLGPSHALHVVRVGERSIVVATSPSSCQVLCDLNQ